MIQLIKGDCLVEMQNIPDKSIDAIICDLPYGTTACKWDTIIPFELLWEQYKRIIKDNGAIVLFGSQPFTSALVMSNVKMFKYEWVWNKKLGGNSMLVKYQPYKIHENILVFGKGKTIYNPIMEIRGKERIKNGKTSKEIENAFNVKGGEKTYNNIYYPQSILEKTNAGRTGRLHPTQKPEALLEYLVKTYTNEGDTVLDNTMGSGTTGVACKNLNRSFIGIEMDDKYFEIAKKRIESHVVQSSF